MSEGDSTTIKAPVASAVHSAAGILWMWLALGLHPAYGQVYAGLSGNGTVVLSNFESAEAPTPLIVAPGATATSTPESTRPDGPRHADLGSIIGRVAHEVDLSPQLLHAVISVESAYNVHALSPKGAQGLMQLMPATATRFGVANPFDAEQNVRGGARYLKSLLALFDGNLQLALAAYNAGEQAVVRHGNKIPPFAETQRYVPKVMARLQRVSRT